MNQWTCKTKSKTMRKQRRCLHPKMNRSCKITTKDIQLIELNVVILISIAECV